MGGWIANDLKAVDFAGGTAVHINAGAAGLALALVLGKRVGFGKEPMRPHNLPLVMLGAGLLWFGWFGFNAGSALGAGNTAAVAWINTLAATAAAALAWIVTEKIRDGHATSLGAASGVVAGLVAITPACSAVNPVGAILVGLIAGALCALAVGLKYRFGYDDSLDVVGVHLVGGVVGTLLIGIFATDKAPAGVDGLLYGGGVDQLWRQAVAAGSVMVFSLRAGVRHRHRDPADDRLPGRRGGRDQRRRPGHPRRVGVRARLGHRWRVPRPVTGRRWTHESTNCSQADSKVDA